jgi:hypothetical protein
MCFWWEGTSTPPALGAPFDVLNDVPRSKEIIESTLQFIKRNL